MICRTYGAPLIQGIVHPALPRWASYVPRLRRWFAARIARLLVPPRLAPIVFSLAYCIASVNARGQAEARPAKRQMLHSRISVTIARAP
jgi:hypothetical protein